MAEADLESDFLLDWAALTQPETPQTQGGLVASHAGMDGSILTEGRPGVARESEDRRKKRLKQAKECSARRRSVESAEQRERRLKDQRDRMALKRQMETAEARESRLERAREREYQRRQNEPHDKRERRLNYSKQKAALRRHQETPEQRERRLDASRMRAAQRRKLQKATAESKLISENPPSVLSQPSESATRRTPREQRVTRQSTQNNATQCVYAESAILQDEGPAVNVMETESKYFTGVDIPIPSPDSSILGATSHITPEQICADLSSSGGSGLIPPLQGEGQEEMVGGAKGEGGGGDGGSMGCRVLEGMGFLERRYDHPDFGYNMERGSGQKQMPVHAIMLNGGVYAPI